MSSSKHPITQSISIRLSIALLALAGLAQAQQFEAEAWTTMAGLQVEATGDAGGGQNVG